MLDIIVNNISYRVGDMLFAIRKFSLDDYQQRTFYYGFGDKFILMQIIEYFTFYELHFNNQDSCFKWCVAFNEFSEFEKYLAPKEVYLKKLRVEKLKKICNI